MASTEATWTAFLFSARGRFNRARYWGATVLVYALMITYLIPAIVADGQNDNLGDSQPTLVIIYVIVGLAGFVALAWIHVCTIVKRFHDRDKPWPWFFILFAPYIGSLWIFVECGCLSGTRGRNRYGADPLNPTGIADVFDGPAIAPPPADPSVGAALPPGRMGAAET